MKEAMSVTEARAELPAILRRLSENPGDQIGITVNGRLAGVIAGPRPTTPAPAGWLYAGRHAASGLPEAIRSLVPSDVTDAYGPTLWIHVASGAIVLLVPSGPWDAPGRPRVHYLSPDRQTCLPLHIDVASWTGDSAAAYHTAMDSARRYVTDLIG